MDSVRKTSKSKYNYGSSRKRKIGDLGSIHRRHLGVKRDRRPLRRKRSLYWDVPPVGFENVSPLKYKEILKHGQYLQSVTPMRREIIAPLLSSTITRHARRLYIGNIPFGIMSDEMIGFFKNQMQLLGICQDNVNPVVGCQINWEKNFAFMEFRSIDETTKAMALNGIAFKNQILKIRRPQDYQPSPNYMEKSTKMRTTHVSPGLISSIVPDSPNKIFVGGIPNFIADDQLTELLQSFGQLRGLNRIKDSITGFYKGYAFCEYIDTSVTNAVVASMNGMMIGDRKLTVQLAILGAKTSPDIRCGERGSFTDSNKPLQSEATEVLCLLNMVTFKDLEDDDEYLDIICDIRKECEYHGIVRSIEVPRLIGNRNFTDCGKVYVEFNSVFDCQKAQQALVGRKFNGRTVVTVYYDSKKYRNRDFT